MYKDYAGGSYLDHTGGAADYVCLPKDPIYQSSSCPLGAAGEMYGAEYQGGCHDDNDVPCAVCRSTNHSSTVMIPARNTCYPGWVEQYRGDLASGAYGHTAASQFVCLDASPEEVPSGGANTNGKLFYAVVGHCGSLPCPPYKEGVALTCVVCAK